MLPLQTRVDMRAMAIYGDSIFPKSRLLNPHDKIVLCHIQDTHWGDLTHLQRCSRCILQAKSTEFSYISISKTVLFLTIQFSISHFSAHSLNVKLLFFTHR